MWRRVWIYTWKLLYNTLAPVTAAGNDIKVNGAGCQWLAPVILATQEAEIRRLVVQSQPRQIVHKTLLRKTRHKKRAGGVAQGEGPEFKSQYCKK
jgi:hypothetical protein